MANLTSLNSISIGNNCFYSTTSFLLTSKNELVYRVIDLPQLKTIVLPDKAFYSTTSFTMSNVNALQSIEFGQNCFYNAPVFSLTGLID